MKPSGALKRYGWIKYAIGNKERGFCIMGAVDHAYPVLGNESWKYNDVYAAIRSKIMVNITHWNDEVCKSKEEAIALLESIGE